MPNNQTAMPKSHAAKSWSEQQLLIQGADQSTKVQWKRPAADGNVFEGAVESGCINNDWHWHYARVIANDNAELTFEVPPGLTFGLIFEGELQLELDERKHHLKATTPQAFCFNNTKPKLITRYFKQGKLVHKFTLAISSSWLKGMRISPFLNARRQELITFSPSEAVINAVKAVMEYNQKQSFSNTLKQMEHVNQILNAVAIALEEQGLTTQAPNTLLSRALEGKLIARVREIISREDILLEDINIENIARSLGTSTSGVQRLAKKCFGESLLKHIRKAKLANAMQAMKERRLSIGESAFLAGYKQTSNFSLAFRKTYGFTPGEVTKRNRGY